MLDNFSNLSFHTDSWPASNSAPEGGSTTRGRPKVHGKGGIVSTQNV